MNTINSRDLSFRSTIIPLNSKKPLVKYFDVINSCNLKSMQNKPIEQCYKELFANAKNTDIANSGVMFDKDALNTPVLRFLGFSKENDEFIFRQLKKIDKDAKYIRDIIDDGYEHGTFELIG